MRLVKRSRIDVYIDQIRDWYESGLTTYQIADRLECSSALVQQTMRRSGIQSRKPGWKKGVKFDRKIFLDQFADEIVRLAGEGLSARQIAGKFGVSNTNVLWWMRKNNVQRRPVGSCPGSLNPAWKGGVCKDDDGYVLVYCPDHPNAVQGKVREHRLVMEKMIGRYLERNEVVDHIDGVKDNNDPSNLRLFQSNKEHLQETLKGKVPNWTEQGKQNISRLNRLEARALRKSNRCVSEICD